MNIVFVCSNPTHVRTFAPVVAELARTGHRSRLLTLDRYYGGGTLAAAASRSLEAEALERPGGQLESPYYDRSVPAIWADVLSARRAAGAQLVALRPDRLAVGNDFGLMEKLLLARAGRSGVPRVLVQDGRLSRTRPRPSGPRGRLSRVARRGLSPVLRGVGLGYLAMSEYGEGPVDVICASGRAAAELLRARSGGRARVVVTGQPRFDGYRTVRPAVGTGHAAPRSIVFFTTPFEADRLGVKPQEAQAGVVQSLIPIADALGATLVVKPHPRDEQDYRQLLGPTGTIDTRPAVEALRDAWVAVLGISTVVEEAGLAGIPVIVPGQVIHGHRFEAQLPPPDVYPRFESAADAAELLRGLLDAGRWEELGRRQQQDVVPDLPSGGTSAAASVAAAIVEG
jgi:hypothetical protein